MLATLDFAWGAPSFLRESDFNGLFSEPVTKAARHFLFFYAVLINGQVWIPAIVNSFARARSDKVQACVPLAQNPSDIMTQGIQIVSDLVHKSVGNGPFDAAGRRNYDDSCRMYRSRFIHHHHASLM